MFVLNPCGLDVEPHQHLWQQRLLDIFGWQDTERD
jgi:hypothetical protein